MTCDQFVSFPRLDFDMGNSDRLSVCHCLEMRVLLNGMCVINDEVRAVRRYDCFEGRVSQTVCVALVGAEHFRCNLPQHVVLDTDLLC